MSDSTTLLLVRHGRTAWNRDARFQGQSDPPLDGAGREQMRQVADRLAPAGAVAVYSSDLSRVSESAGIIAGRLGLRAETRAELRERSYGAWEGLTRQELEARFPESWHQWLAAPQAHRPEGGETLDEMTARVVAFLEAVIARHVEGRIVIVSHGGPIKSAVMHWLDMPMSHRRGFVIHNASLTVLVLRGGQAALEMLNDTCHLGGVEDEWAV